MKIYGNLEAERVFANSVITSYNFTDDLLLIK
jgi:hypothetical protein